MVFVDGVEVGDIEDVALRDRRALSADGIFIVVATVSGQDGHPIAPPEVISRGVPFLTEEDGVVEEIRETVEASLAQAAADEVHEISLLQEHLRDDVVAFIYERLRRPPDGAADCRRRGLGLNRGQGWGRAVRVREPPPSGCGHGNAGSISPYLPSGPVRAGLGRRCGLDRLFWPALEHRQQREVRRGKAPSSARAPRGSRDHRHRPCARRSSLTTSRPPPPVAACEEWRR